MQKTRNGTWQVRWREEGKQRAKTFRTKEQAKHFESELNLGRAETHQSSSITFEQFARRWHEDYCKVEKSESEWISDESKIRVHLIPAFGDKKLKDLTKSDLLRFRADLVASEKQKPKTINNIIGLAKKMMQTAIDWDLLAVSPWVSVKPLKIPEQPYGYWMPAVLDQYLAYVQTVDPEHFDAAALAGHTGLRLGELQALQWTDVDFQRLMLDVHRGWLFKKRKALPYTKGKNLRRVPMNQFAQAILTKRYAATKGGKLTDRVFPENLRNAVDKIARYAPKAGVQKIRFHDLRHTFASALVMAGVPMATVQSILGHSDIRETQRYSHLAPDFLKGTTDLLVRDLCVPALPEGKSLVKSISTWCEEGDLNPTVLKIVS